MLKEDNQKLTVEIWSKTGNFIYSIEEVLKQVQNGFIKGFNRNEDERYYFEIRDDKR